MGFFLFDWLDGVPANVIANAIALVLGVVAVRLSTKVANRRIWSLKEASKLVIFVAEDSREFVSKGDASYVRPSTGVGQVRALSLIATSLRTAYRNVDLGKVIMSGEGIKSELRSDLITLGGAKNNLVTRQIMRKLSQLYALPVPSPREGLSWINEHGEQPRLYEPYGGGKDGDLTGDDQIERDYGVIVKAPNPWNPNSTVIVVYGASTHGTAAAAAYFVEQRRWLRLKYFTALVTVNVIGGYNGEPTLCGLRSLEENPLGPKTAKGPEVQHFRK